MPHARLLSVLLLAFGSGLSAAQPLMEEEDLALAYGDQRFVSIATGSRQPLNKAPSAATVITAEQIASMGARTLTQALEAVPGLHVSLNNLQNNYTPAYGMRGILTGTAPHVLMMVNGIPRTSVYLGNPDEMMVELPVDNIARIEVIRGPGSAIYGADAFAGTINVITKTASDVEGTSFGIGTGSFESTDAWLQHGSRHDALDVAAYLRVGRSDGQRRNILDAFGRSGPLNVGHDDVDGQLDIGFDKFRWRTSYTLRDNIGTAAGIAAALDPVGRARSERFSSDLSWSDASFARDLSLTLQASFMYLTNEVATPLVVIPGGILPGFPDGMIGDPDKWERQSRYAATAVYSGVAAHRLRFGVGHDDLEIYRTRERKNFTQIPGPLPTPLPMYQADGANLFLAPHARHLNYAYLQDEWSFARDWTLTSGIRRDTYSDFGGTTNPRLALVWAARHDLTTKLMYGTAFRAPSFIELYATGNPVAMGNPSLTPERIRTLEAAISWQPRHDLHTSVSLFQHRISDIITQVGNSYLNGGRQRGHGGELEVVWAAIDDLQLSGHYAYQKNTDERTGHDAGYAPRHHLYVRADWRFVPGWQLSTQVNHVAGRKRAHGDDRPPLADYTATDLTLRSDRTRRGWDFAVSVHNLFDADIREPSRPSLNGSVIPQDLPLPGRTLWLQARFNL